MMRKKLIYYAGVPVSLVVILIAAFIWFVNRGFSARDQPSFVETVVARSVRNLAIPSDYKALKSPRQISESDITAASEHFAMSCAVCHAVDGRGGTSIGKNLYPKVPDLTKAETQNLTDGEIYYIILNGVRLTGMPAWSEDNKDEIWSLVSFIRRTPKLTSQEINRLIQVNESNK